MKSSLNMLLKGALSIAAAAAFSACGGGGGNSSTGGVYFTHEQLAQEFVRRLNIDVPGYNVSLVKTNTLQYDYIVVYDQDFRTYDAYYIGFYNPGENLSNYLNYNESNFYYDLMNMNDGTYKDFLTGRLFDNDDFQSMNVEKAAKLVDLTLINRTETKLREMGLYEEAAQDFARGLVYAAHAQKAGQPLDKGAMDRLTAKYAGGITYSQLLKATAAGNTDVQARFAADLKSNTGMTDEGLKSLFSK